MTFIKSVINKFKMLPRSRRVEIMLAIVLTITLCISIPVYAWFSGQRKVAQLAKIKAPDDLYINAAHREDIINLDMTAVNVNSKYTVTENGLLHDVPITSQGYVFSISGEWVNSYTLQIEHTTNIPFTYTICEGELYTSIADMRTEHPDCETRNADGSLKYVEYVATNVYDSDEVQKITNWPSDGLNISTGEKYYVWIGNEVTNKQGQTGGYLNKTANAGYANDVLLDKSYSEDHQYQINAKPLFWQLKNIKASDTKAPFYNTYVIKIDWTGVNNITDYNKETDLFYISVFVE